MKRPAKKEERVDPIFQETPWDLVYDEHRRVIGEIYLLPAKMMFEGMPMKRRKSKKMNELSEFAKQLDSLVMTDEQVIAQIVKCIGDGIPINISTMRRGLEILLVERMTRPQLIAGLKPLNKRQAHTFEFIKLFLATNGYPPTIREIAEGIGVLSSSTVHGHLERLENKGYIKRNSAGGRSRSLQITGIREVGADEVCGDRSGD
jgi:DNA-binding transcriptional ArsR family regulator